jgi:anti-anti-sigma factor
VVGPFDLSCHAALRAAYAEALPGSQYIVDFEKASYVDGAALGMLLLMREHLREQGGQVTLTGCHGPIYEMLYIANFHRSFQIRM